MQALTSHASFASDMLCGAAHRCSPETQNLCFIVS